MDFAHVIYPCSVSDFFQNYFEKSFFFSRRNNADHYREVLSENDLDLFFSQQDISPKGIRVVKNGILIPKDQWTGASEHSPGILVAQSGQLIRHYCDGATLVISGAQNKFPGLAKACSAFEQETRISIQANIYITPPGSQGFSMHYDDHDIFTLQIKGPKRWKLYDSGEELPTSKKPFTKTPEFLEELELNAGDLLYIPRGLAHEAYSTDVSTIHVNFSCTGSYGFNLLDGLSALAEEGDVFFRKMLPNAFSSEEEVRSYTDEFTAKLKALIAGNSVETLLKNYEARFSEVQIIDRKGMFADAIAMEGLNKDSVVKRRNSITYRLEKKNGISTIFFKKQSIAVSQIFDISIFLQDEAFKVSDIKGLVTASSRLVMVREFIKAGFLQVQLPSHKV